MIWWVARGALGNQLCGWASATLQAHSRGDPLVIDGSLVGQAYGPAIRLQLADWAVDSPVEMKFFAPGRDGTRRARILSTPRKVMAGLKAVRPRTGVSKWTPVLLDQFYMNRDDILTSIANGIFNDLRLAAPSKEHMERLGELDQEEIGVHVRLGDFRLYEGGRYLLSKTWYRDAFERFGDIRGARIRVFSDYPSEAVVFLEEALADLNCSFVAIDSLTPSEDLDLLSRHRRIILSRSSFAWWAGLLSKDSHIVAPAGGVVEPCDFWEIVADR